MFFVVDDLPFTNFFFLYSYLQLEPIRKEQSELEKDLDSLQVQFEQTQGSPYAMTAQELSAARMALFESHRNKNKA